MSQTNAGPDGSSTPAGRGLPPRYILALAPGWRLVGQRLLVLLLGAYLVSLVLALLVALVHLWPSHKAGETAWEPVTVIWRTGPVSDDARLLLIVLLTGALGSYVHAATSFVSFVGNRSLRTSWLLWYAMRPFIGMALALIFYFALRGGLLTTSADADKLSPYGVAAVAGLVGMFSKQASDKLRELFDNLFRTAKGEGDDARGDKLNTNLPVTEAMIPRHKISAEVLSDVREADQVKLVDLVERLGGVVTRVPVFDAEARLVCVIHQSLLYKFLADRTIAGKDKPPPVDSHTLADLLADPAMKALVQEANAFVPEDATLSEAREQMQATANCQDVFVTTHGTALEKVLGWMTDTELLRGGKS